MPAAGVAPTATLSPPTAAPTIARTSTATLTATATETRPSPSTEPSVSSEEQALTHLSADGYPYTVLPGESWIVVSERTGVSLQMLQAANPQAIRPSGWLMVNEVLEIPVAPQADWPRTGVGVYTVRTGDSWSRIGAHFAVSPTLLWAVNPTLRRPWQVLVAGDPMTIPPAPRWPAP